MGWIRRPLSGVQASTFEAGRRIVPGEWIGLVGTAIGTGIGAMAAVGSLIVRARQEAFADERRHLRDLESRSRERAWEITFAGLEARRAAFISLIEAVTIFEQRVRLLAGPSHEAEGSEAAELCADLHRLSAMVPTIEMHAQNEAVGALLRTLLDNGQILLAAWSNGHSSVRHDHISLATEDVERLRNACRWDLGLNGANPKTFLRPETSA